MKRLIILLALTAGLPGSALWAGNINVLVRFDVSQAKSINGAKLNDAIMPLLSDTQKVHFINEVNRQTALRLVESSKKDKTLSDDDKRFITANLSQVYDIILVVKVTSNPDEVMVTIKAVLGKNNKKLFEDGFQIDPTKTKDAFGAVVKSSVDLIQKDLDKFAAKD